MSDALDRIRQRQRPTVPKRDATLKPESLDISTSRNLDFENSKPLEGKVPSQKESQISRIPDISNSRHLDTQISIPKPQTKQTTLRLEKELSDRLQASCRQQGICREALIEAMFEYIESHPEAASAVFSEAVQKNSDRQQIANFKRAQSMLKRFQS